METESDHEDAQTLIAELANSPGSNMIQAISDGLIQPLHSLYELKMQIMHGKLFDDQYYIAPESRIQFSVHPMH